MVYDPQRRHERPRVTEESGTAPVDALLGSPPIGVNADAAAAVELSPVSAGHGGSGRKLVGIVLVVVVVLAFLAARRVRHRRISAT